MQIKTISKSRLDAIMPKCDYYEKHQIVVNASPEKVYRAAKELTGREMLLMRILMSIRSLPAGKTFDIDPDRPLLEVIYTKGFTLLDDVKNSEVVFGTIEQFWKLSSEDIAVKDLNEFAKFNTPMYLKAAGNLYVKSMNGKTLLTTETRVVATSNEAKQKFRLYWILIRCGSGLIRRMWLSAIKRRAEMNM